MTAPTPHPALAERPARPGARPAAPSAFAAPVRQPATLATALAALAALAAVASLAGCAALPGPGASPSVAGLTAASNVTPTPLAASAPADWQTALPHEGRTEALAQWWNRFDDPLLPRLIEQAQAASPTLSTARARLEQARAARVQAGAALGPTLDASASAVRGRSDLTLPSGTSLAAGLQAGWELDLFGGNQAAQRAAQERFTGAAALWHDARISVAADTALSYLQLRACEAQLGLTEQDVRSRNETARLTEASERAGFQSPSAAALARASAAQARVNLAALRAQCDTAVKALVALTAQDEPTLRQRLATATGRLPAAAPLALAPATVPAEALQQRPDLRAAEAEWRAAAADLAQADAARYPRVTLGGSVGYSRLSGSNLTVAGSTWTIGPVSVTLPILDGGRRAAQSAAAQARLDDARVQLEAGVRRAVREVEDALLQLRSTAERTADAELAARDFEASFRAAEARQRGGLASLFELEDARRTAVAASAALVDLQRERLAAWIALYRAVGGGWSASDPAPDAG